MDMDGFDEHFSLFDKVDSPLWRRQAMKILLDLPPIEVQSDKQKEICKLLLKYLISKKSRTNAETVRQIWIRDNQDTRYRLQVLQSRLQNQGNVCQRLKVSQEMSRLASSLRSMELKDLHGVENQFWKEKCERYLSSESNLNGASRTYQSTSSSGCKSYSALSAKLTELENQLDKSASYHRKSEEQSISITFKILIFMFIITLLLAGIISTFYMDKYLS